MPLASQATINAGTPRETSAKALLAKGSGMTATEQRTALITLALELFDRVAVLEQKVTALGG